MSSDDFNQVKILLKDYIEKSLNTPDIHWDQSLRNPDLLLTFNPYDESQKEITAQYFLMVAAIDRPEYVTRSETTRALMVQIYRSLGKDCFKKGQAENFEKIVHELSPFLRFGENKDQIPKVLDAVNSYVEEKANGRLVQHSQNFVNPSQMVEELSNNMFCFQGKYFEHTWMYVRWMTRKFPDFNMFKFQSSNLQIPLTRYVRFIAGCLGFCSNEPNLNHPEIINQERRLFTEFAAKPDMFPDDPTVVDYPFYVLGRWLYGENPSLCLIRKYLEFWRRVFERVKMAPIEFDLVRAETGFEKEIRQELEKFNFMLDPGPSSFRLPKESGVPKYTPDFVLHKCSKKGKTVVLEPHGPWTPREDRTYMINGKPYSILANPTVIDRHELEFVNKLRLFRKNYGEQYYLVLILPSQVINRVKWDYPDIADEMCEGRDLPKLLYSLKRDDDTEKTITSNSNKVSLNLH